MAATAIVQSHTARASFEPPPSRGRGRAFALALLAHVLLVLVLAWGLRWKKDAQDQAVDAELWSATAQIAAPKAALVQPPPPPPPPPVEPPRPVLPPQPKPVPQVTDDSAREAELALEQQKKRDEQQRQAEQIRRLEQQQQRLLQQAKAAQQAAAKARAEKKAAEQQAAAAKADEQRAEAAREAKADAARRQATLRGLIAQASADQSGMASTAVNGPGKTPGGTARRDAGPSANYAAKVRARIFPNITYPDLSNIKGNPDAEVQVRTSPDGTIIDRQVTKSSGVPSWDAAVLRAIDKTQTLPRDVDGRVPSPIIIGFTPR